MDIRPKVIRCSDIYAKGIKIFLKFCIEFPSTHACNNKHKIKSQTFMQLLVIRLSSLVYSDYLHTVHYPTEYKPFAVLGAVCIQFES